MSHVVGKGRTARETYPQSVGVGSSGITGDHKVLVNVTDTTPDFLEAKVMAGFGVIITPVDLGGGDLALSIAANVPPGTSDHKVLVDGADTTAAFLAAKIVAGANITLTVLNPAGNEQISVSLSGAAGGDLAGTYPNPTVVALETTTGPTRLAIGAIADTQVLVRSGATIIGAAATFPPSGAAGGDLAGTYPNPTVVAVEETGGPTRLAIGAIANGQVVVRSGATLIGTTASFPPSGAAGGDLGGTYPNPTVVAVEETGGPTRLTIGAIAAGQVVVRSGTSLIGTTASFPPSGAAGGDLGGTYPNPTVVAIEETGGPTRLAIGAISNGQLLVRSGATVIGTAITAVGDHKVMVTGADTTPNYLSSKIAVAGGLALSVLNAGGNEQLQIDASGVLVGNWASVLTAGNVTGGNDTIWTSGDKLKGQAGVASDGGPLTMIGGAGDATFLGGAVTVQGGPGGTTGNGGLTTVIGGVGGTTGIGGVAVLQGGAGGTVSGNGAGAQIKGGTPVDGNGGAVLIVGADGATITGANRSGGGISLNGGNGVNTANGGTINISAGNSGTTGGTPGSVTAGAGAAGVGSGGAGGSAQVSGGAGDGAGSGGTLNLFGGAAGATGVGGQTALVGGNGGATSGAGGQVSVLGGGATDGAGGLALVRGGAAASGATNRNGGQAQVIGGTGILGGSGGSATLQGGAAGLTGGGGAITIAGGAGGATSGSGGAVNISGGTPSDGNGGAITLTAGAGVTSTATTRNGGAVSISAGASVSGGLAGSITLTAGSSASTGTSGSITFTAGSGGTTAGKIQGTAGAAAAASNATGGAIIWTAGNGATTNGSGGAYTATAGNAVGGGTAGAATMTAGTGGSSTVGGIASVVGGAGGSASGAGGQAKLTGGVGTAGNAAGGASTVTGGAGQGSAAGGVASIVSGAGGATGAGATTLVTGGAGGATSGAAGGVTVAGGVPVDGAGGAITFTGSAGVGTNRAGGGISGTAGNATGNAAGGSYTLTAGASVTGAAGTVTVTGGAGGSTSGAAGGVTVIGGTPIEGAGANITITASAGVTATATARNGGSVDIRCGAAVSGGTTGAVNLRDSANTVRLFVDVTNGVNFVDTAATANAGAAALPANPVGFIVIGIAGTVRKIPYYAT